jgi:uncharacterized membrane protein YbaN (DUF454 family)
MIATRALFAGYNGWMRVSLAQLKRRLLVVAGTVALGIGVVGVFLPILPTTPFLLLAAACYMRGSQRLYNGLLRNRLIGAYVRDYLQGRGMPVKAKIWTLGLLWASIVCSAAFVTDSFVVRITLAVVLAGVTVHIVLIRTRNNNVAASSNEPFTED